MIASLDNLQLVIADVSSQRHAYQLITHRVPMVCGILTAVRLGGGSLGKGRRIAQISVRCRAALEGLNRLWEKHERHLVSLDCAIVHAWYSLTFLYR